jgi:hypothetical protein
VLVMYGDNAIITAATPPILLQLYIPFISQWVLNVRCSTVKLFQEPLIFVRVDQTGLLSCLQKTWDVIVNLVNNTKTNY